MVSMAACTYCALCPVGVSVCVDQVGSLIRKKTQRLLDAKHELMR